jgi:poly(hydroxyalkanoate) granule-associated protein
MAVRREKKPEMLAQLNEIWLAGLAALADARQRGPKVLEQLLAEGARIQEQTRAAADKAVRGALADVQSGVGMRIEDARAQAGDALENLEKMFHTRVHRALGQLGVPTAAEIDALSRRVEALNASVSALAGRRGAATRVRRGKAKRTGKAAPAKAKARARRRGSRSA